MKMKDILVIFLCLAPAKVCASEIFNCRGDLITFGYKEGSAIQLNSVNQEKFSIARDKYLSISVTIDGKNEIAKIFPWNGIHFKQLKYAQVNSIVVSHFTDGEHWFEIQASKDKNSKSLTCQFQQF